jgi:hypothetical protein
VLHVVFYPNKLCVVGSHVVTRIFTDFVEQFTLNAWRHPRRAFAPHFDWFVFCQSVAACISIKWLKEE